MLSCRVRCAVGPVGALIQRRRLKKSDGGVSAIEFALLTPVLLLTIMLVIQYAMYFHARHVASAAAQEGARVARTSEGNWVAAAEQQAQEYLNFIGDHLITDTQIVARSPAPGRRGVRVTGNAVEVLPFLTLRVVEYSYGPRECFRSDATDAGSGVAC